MTRKYTRVAAYLLGALGNVLVSGYILVLFWSWFVTSTFPVSQITFWPAAGILLTTRLVTRSMFARDDGPPIKDWDSVGFEFFRGTLSLAGILLLGWLIHCMMI